MKISWSRLDQFEKIHRCLRKFEDRVITKPIIIDDIVTKMEKLDEQTDKVFEHGTGFEDIGAVTAEADSMQAGNKLSRRRVK